MLRADRPSCGGEIAARPAPQPDRHPDRRPALRRGRPVRPSVHVDAAHRPHRVGRRAVRQRVPHHAAVFAEPRVDPHRPVRRPTRRDRQRGARCTEPSAAELPRRAAAPRLRNRARRQMAHGQQRRTAAGLRPLGQLSGARQHRRSGAQHRRHAIAAARLHHRPAQRPRARFRRTQAPQAVRAVSRAQGGAPRCLPGRRRHAGTGPGWLSCRAAPCRAVPRRVLSATAQRDAGRAGAESKTGFRRGVRAARQRHAVAR